MKVSFITTVYNEEKTITKLLQSVANQSRLPDEIIIVDGGSQDQTKAVILQAIQTFKNIPMKLLIKKGNRSVGRNEAIKNAKGDIIAISDAGCILEKHWLWYLLEPFAEASVDVVAGYYKGVGSTLFEKSLIPYVLVMPDKLNPKNFLPATRSMAIKKKVWEKLGGFSERLSHNEDYAFAKKLKQVGAHIVFAQKAVAAWYPRKSFGEAFIMFYRFAYGDAQAKILRPKVTLLFVRYFFALVLLVVAFVMQNSFLIQLLLLLLLLYWFWAVWKNIRYVKQAGAYYMLFLIQLTADIAVMLGSLGGWFHQKKT